MVMMDKSSYTAEGARQLNNTIHYAKPDVPIYLNTAKLVSDILNRLKSSGRIIEKQLHFLLPLYAVWPYQCYLYMLRKIHKEASF